jgi:hypothetical protein
MVTIVKVYTGVYITKGTPAVCGALFETNGQFTYEFIEMENVSGICTLISNELRKWQKTKSGMENIELTVLIHENNKNAFKAISKVATALNLIPPGTVGAPRSNLIKFHIRNKNYEKQLAYDQLTDLVNEILNYNQLPAPGTLKVNVQTSPGIGYVKAIWGAAQGHWDDLQAAKQVSSNVIHFPNSVTPKKQ